MENLENMSNNDLQYIIQFCESHRKEAHLQFLRLIGIEEIPNESILIKNISENVMSCPSNLKMDNWHCGTQHCIAGWATTLNPIAREIEKRYNTETAGFAVLPNYAQYFYSDNDTVLEMLKNVK